MLITTFINICKDTFYMLLFTLNSIINALFSMNLFWDGSSYVVSVGEILFAFIVCGTIFAFLINAIISHFRG